MKEPLGYIELENGPKAVYPMNDIFLNYTFENPENWGILKLLVNTLIAPYIESTPHTTLKPIEAIKQVLTQYKFILNTNNASRNQDFKVEETTGDAAYVEFQNRAYPPKPVAISSAEYFGLGVGHAQGKLANQIWLLAQDIPELLAGQTFARYILKEETTNTNHPHNSGIMYVSLKKLATLPGDAGQLAQFLLGQTIPNPSPTLQNVAQAFSGSFTAFKEDKEVSQVMTMRERWKLEDRSEGFGEGKAEGQAEGKADTLKKLAAFFKEGLTPEEIMAALQHA